MQNSNARNNDPACYSQQRRIAIYKPSGTVAGAASEYTLSRGSLTEESIGVSSVRRARSLPRRTRERYIILYTRNCARTKARGREEKIKREYRERAACSKLKESREQHPSDRLASPRVDRPIDLELLTRTYRQHQYYRRRRRRYQPALGADGGPPFCELRNGPKSNARDKFTGRRAERSRFKNTAFVQPVKKG